MTDSPAWGAIPSGDGRWRLALDRACLDVADRGWDSGMVEYPFVLDHGGQYFMFYNGNGYGKTGFGLAVLDDD